MRSRLSLHILWTAAWRDGALSWIRPATWLHSVNEIAVLFPTPTPPSPFPHTHTHTHTHISTHPHTPPTPHPPPTPHTHTHTQDSPTINDVPRESTATSSMCSETLVEPSPGPTKTCHLTLPLLGRGETPEVMTEVIGQLGPAFSCNPLPLPPPKNLWHITVLRGSKQFIVRNSKWNLL